MTRLKNQFKIYAGSTPDSKNEEYWNGNVVWVTPADFKTDDKYVSKGAKTLTEAGYASCNTTLVPAGSLVVSKRAPVGTVAIAGTKLCTNQGCLTCVPKAGVNSEFYYYVLSCMQRNMESLAQGTTFLEISAQSFANMSVPAPSTQKQADIAIYLREHCSSIDSAISKHHQIIEKLEEYRKAVITQAVTKGLNQNVEMKYSCIPWVTSIPEKWSEQPLKLLFSNRKNKNTDCAETNLLSLSYGRIIRKDINSNEGLLPENFSDYNIIEPNDIVLRLTDLQNDHRSLRTGLVTEHGIITSAYVTLCPKANINSEYYHYLLHAYDVQKVFYTLGEGIRQSLKYEDLGKVLVPVPPRVEQDEIVHYLNAMSKMVDDVIDKHNQLISKLQEYKQSLIYNAVTGKIDCTTEA
ncbi:MAG: restriction endonuclease subunit S [Lachnospiraceae bacterium]|nr:restriction endonuclease subunit S [Lachnospiraceae bacterium]